MNWKSRAFKLTLWLVDRANLILLIVVIVLLFVGEFLLAIAFAALMIFAIFIMIRQSRYAEVFREEQARVAAQ